MTLRIKPIRLGNKPSSGSELVILKGTGKDMVIAGYASVDVVDKQNDLITLDALKEASDKFMKSDYKNVMITHSNVQVGEVINTFTDTKGNVLKTGVDDTGFFVVIKMRNDIEKAKEVSRDIRRGKLRSFSIGGQAINKHNVHDPDIGTYKEIDKLELHEITICEEGINPEAKFEIVKENKKGSETMTDEISKALAEFEDLVSQLRNQTILKDDSDDEKMNAEEEMEMMDEEENMEYKAEDDDEEMMDDDAEEKAIDSTVYGHNATGQKMGEANLTGRYDSEFSQFLARKSQQIDTLDLSDENISKAYAQFKAEKEEERTYDVIKEQFEARYQAELAQEANTIAKENYDAHSEVAALKNEFAQLRKSLNSHKEVIAKQAVPTTQPTISEDVISKMSNLHEMSWDEINEMVRELQ